MQLALCYSIPRNSLGLLEHLAYQGPLAIHQLDATHYSETTTLIGGGIYLQLFFNCASDGVHPFKIVIFLRATTAVQS